MIFASKYLADELVIQREENARLRAHISELIDKFIHNRQPERLVKPKVEKEPELSVESGAGDPVSAAERLAWEASWPKEQG